MTINSVRQSVAMTTEDPELAGESNEELSCLHGEQAAR